MSPSPFWTSPSKKSIPSSAGVLTFALLGPAAEEDLLVETGGGGIAIDVGLEGGAFEDGAAAGGGGVGAGRVGAFFEELLAVAEGSFSLTA